MKAIWFLLISAFLLATACSPDTGSGTSNELSPSYIELARALGGLEFEKPVALVFPADSNETGYIVEQSGRIMSAEFNGGTWTVSVFLNIEERVSDRGREEGLLGLALGPGFPAEPHFFVNYTAADPRRTVVSRFSLNPADPSEADPTSEQVILEVGQPYSNHNGGHLTFGPDGYLYIGFGDGGSAGDPKRNGQNPGTMLGTIIRIDISSLGPARTYDIPDGNPFVGVEGTRPEVWAYGLRNPWRFSFDSLTGELWAADVGQNEREEVNVIQPGLNYGWNIMEGTLCFARRDQSCSQESLEPPLTEYGRDGGCSVTGGYVYRGERIRGLYGSYVFGDFCSGKIWSFDPDTAETAELLDTDLDIASFAEDPDGELYVVSLDGRVYAIASSDETK